MAEAPFPNAADGKWHHVSVVQQNEALRLSWDGSDGLGLTTAAATNHKHLAFMPNSHIDFGKLKMKPIRHYNFCADSGLAFYRSRL